VKSHPSEHKADVFIVLPQGRLDALAAPELDKALISLEEKGTLQIVVNFSQTSYISSGPLRIMLVHTRKLRQAGGDLKLCCLSDKVAQVLHIAGLDVVFDILPTEELAVQAFSSLSQNKKKDHD